MNFYKMFFRICFLIILNYPCLVDAQDVIRARLTIDSLCSGGLHGRGPSFKGDSIASFYLKHKYETIGLKKFNYNFFQYFKYNVNIFPGELNLTLGKTLLTPGRDYITHSASGNGKATLSVLYLDTTIFTNEKSLQLFFEKKLTDKAIFFPSKFSSKLETLPKNYLLALYESGGLIEIIEKKLTASISTHQLPTPYFQVLRDAIPRKTKKIKFEVNAEYIQDYTSRNIIGYLPASTPTDSFIVISAHYDHLGNLGKNSYFPGANDNASGVSMLLELANYYAESGRYLKYGIVFIAFAAEEAGLIGSKFYTEHPYFPLNKIRFLINLDLMGTGDDGMMAVNGSIFPKEFNLLERINNDKSYIPAVKKRGKAANSDHYFFSEKGVPAFFFYTLGGTPAYHDMYDRAETLPLTKYKEVFKLLRDFIETF